MLKPLSKICLLFLLACSGLLVYALLDANNILQTLQDGTAIQRYIESLGTMGPVMVVIMMSIAILVSPLPSAPIAIAAGAAYGHTWGTIYILMGSVLGASGAFMVARYLGYEYVHKLTRDYLNLRLFESQHALTGIVLVSRLLPFLSFDVISYAAGLTALEYWRFALATFLGIVPASFLLAHVGSEMATAELSRITTALVLLGVLTLVAALANRLRRTKTHRPD